MIVDYTKWAVGMSPAPRVVLSLCPRCGQVGHKRTLSTSVHWVHSVGIERVGITPKAVKPTKQLPMFAEAAPGGMATKLKAKPNSRCRFALEEAEELGLFPADKGKP